MEKPVLIVFAGLPGVGKTTLARALSRRIGAAFLRIDSIEQALANSTLSIRPAEDAGYMVGYAVAEDNLRNGRTVVADSVNPIERSRAAWIDVARKAECAALEVEIICSDASEHRARVETRCADLPGHRLPTWQHVLDREYEDWTRPHIIIDTAAKSVDSCIEELLRALADR